MLAVYDDGAPAPCPNPFNLAAYVMRHADRLADKTALEIIGNTTKEYWSYGQLEHAIKATGTGLIETGLTPGDRILLRLGNTSDFPICFLGAVAAGLIPVSVSSALTAPELAALVNDITPAAILIDPNLTTPESPSCPAYDLKTIQAWRGCSPCKYNMGAPDRPGYIVFTSGTSGRQRAVVHAHRAIWARQMMRAGWDGIKSEDRVMHAGAFNWTYTLGTGLLDPWSQGATALIPAQNTPAKDLGGMLQEHKATIFAAAPAFYRRMLAKGLSQMPYLRHGLAAGEVLSSTLSNAWRSQTGRPVYEALGMSECSTFISGSEERPAPKGTSGYPQPGRKVAVLTPDGNLAKRGQPGELAISKHDPGLFLQYYNAKEETAGRFKDEWFCTGDSVTMKSDGAIVFHGRLDDMMNAGGVRVSPIEVETALATHPDISDIAVVDVKVKADTTVIAAFYTAHSPLEDHELSAFASERLARYKCPRLWQCLPELPRTKTGKTDRRALRAAFESAAP